jgi:hypothetical protein
MSLVVRIAVITLGLAAAGFVAGGIVGGLMMTGWLFADDPSSFSYRRTYDVLLFGAAFGGVVRRGAACGRGHGRKHCAGTALRMIFPAAPLSPAIDRPSGGRPDARDRAHPRER